MLNPAFYRYVIFIFRRCDWLNGEKGASKFIANHFDGVLIAGILDKIDLFLRGDITLSEGFQNPDKEKRPIDRVDRAFGTKAIQRDYKICFSRICALKR